MNSIIDIDQILLYYDTIQLFIGTAQIGTMYLCMLYDDHNIDKYIGIRISKQKLSLLLSGRNDLRSIFLSPEIPEEYFSITILEGNKYILDATLPTIEEYMLPAEDAFIIPSNDYSDLIEERLEWGKPIVHLGFIDNNNSHYIKASALSSLISDYQDFVTNTYKKINETPQARVITPNFNIFKSSAASFNLHMYIDDDLDLFGGSSMDSTLDFINALLDFENEDMLKESLGRIQGYAFSHYKRFIKGLVNNNLCIKSAWTTSDIEHPVSYNQIQSDKIQYAYEVLKRSTELEQEHIELIGFFLKVDSTNGDWKFYCTIDEKEYKGKSLNSEILNGLTVRTKDYKITCTKTAEKQTISDKLIEVYYLDQINEI